MKEKVLIVDDDPTISVLAKMILSKNDLYKVYTADNGQAALDMLAEIAPDIIILDIMMPVMDGFELTKRLKKNESTKFIPIIMITAKSSVEDKVKGMKLGANDYITKPFDPEELLARVSAQLRIKELEKELGLQKEVDSIIKAAATLQHEINNPLTGIIGNLEILMDWQELAADEIDQSLKEIMLLAVRVKDIVIKMGNISKAISTEYIPGSQMLDLSKSADIASEEDEKL